METFFNRMGQLGATFLFGGIILSRFVFVVDAGERGVLFDKVRGLQTKIYGEGMHFMIPVVQSPRIFEVRARPQMIHSQTPTRDMQRVDLALRILFRPREDKLSEILNKIGIDYDDRVIPSIGNEVLKSVVAHYNADQLLTQREKVSLEIKEVLSKRAAEFDILLDDVSITHLQFTDQFTKAIEAKQIQQQIAEKARFVVSRKEEEKRAAIIRAEGEAEAAKLVSDAISEFGPGLIAMRKIDVAQHMAEVLANNQNVTFITGGNTMNMLQIPAGR